MIDDEHAGQGQNLWGFRSLSDLEKHYLFHQEAEIGWSLVPKFASIDEYGEAAWHFKNAPASVEIKECQRTKVDNRHIRYNAITQEYLILSPDKQIIISYYFKNLSQSQFAQNLQAFHRDCQRSR